MAGYWVAQVAGGILASLALAFVISKDTVAGTITVVNSQFVDTFGGFVGEALLTMIFVMAVLVMSKSTSYTKDIGIGFTLTAVHLIGIPFTGASVNPDSFTCPGDRRRRVQRHLDLPGRTGHGCGACVGAVQVHCDR